MARAAWKRALFYPQQITAEFRRKEVSAYVTAVTKFEPRFAEAITLISAVTVGSGVPEDALTYGFYLPSVGKVDRTFELNDGSTVRARALFRVHFYLSGYMLLTDSTGRAAEFRVMELAKLYRAIDELLSEEV